MFAEGRTSTFEALARTRIGETIAMEVSTVPFALDGKLLLFASARDITARKQAEEALRHSEELARDRLEEIARQQRRDTANEMAGVLAHELNQPLGAIAVYAEVCRQLLDKPTEDREGKLADALERIGQQSLRAGEIIQHMRRLVARASILAEAVDLNAVIRSARDLMEPIARHNGIRIATRLAPELPPVMGVEVQLEQVLLNLMRNAFDAILEHGTDGGEVCIETSAADGKARITVTDSGPGIGPERAAQLFDLASSQKPNGLGLGLRISRGLVEAHRGRLWVEPHSPGAVFHVELPLA